MQIPLLPIESVKLGDDHDGVLVDNSSSFAGNYTATSPFPVIEYQWIFWFSIATAAAFVALASVRVLCLLRCSPVARPPTTLLAAKLFAGSVLTGLRLGLLVFVANHEQISLWDTFRSLKAATTLSLLAACLLFLLSLLEHSRSHRPSVQTCLFLLITFLCDVTLCPFLWTSLSTHGFDRRHAVFVTLFTAVVVVEFVFLLLESVWRSDWVIAWNTAEHSPEETSSILSLGLYSWLNSLLLKGYQTPLCMHHLFPLDQAIAVDAIDAHAAQQTSTSTKGQEYKEKLKEVSTLHLLLWLARPLGSSLLLPILPRLCLLGFTFCQPFFLQRLLRFLSSEEDGASTTISAFVVVALFIYSGIAISTALYWYYQERFQSLLRTFLISAIYRKTNRVQHVGDGDSTAVTLMGADVERIYTGLRFVHEIWANSIQITLAAWLLQRQLGLAFLAPLVVVIVGFGSSFVLSKRAVPYQSTWMTRLQARIGITSAVLSRIKDLRVSGMIKPAVALLRSEREEEIKAGERSRVLIAVSASLSQLPSAMAPALAFAFGPRVLDETRAYTALSCLTLLTAPLLVVLQSLPIIAACLACLRRINTFLIRQDRTDYRLLVPKDDILSSVEERGTDNSFITVQNGSFGWTPHKPILKNIELCLPRASITIVVGPVASGKSTLCRALLGEVPYAQGSVALRSKKIGYCDQVPFLFNVSVRENIIGPMAFDSERYIEVLLATKLFEDIEGFTAGDSTVVGSKGVSLSGGQRQRVSLARALYHQADILVMDDIFSGLDGSTQGFVCQSVLGPGGLLRRRGTTAIVCTHSTHILNVADRVVALSNEGEIVEQSELFDMLQDETRARRFGPRVDQDCCDEAIDKHPQTEQHDIARQQETVEGAVVDSTLELVKDRLYRDFGATKIQTLPAPAPVIASIEFDIYRHWLSTIGSAPLLLYLLLIIGVGFCSNFPTIWLKLWSADSISPNPQHAFAFWIGIYALLGAGVILCILPAGAIMLRTAVRLAGSSLHHAAVHTIMHASLRFLTETDVGKVLNLFSQDLNILDTQLPRMVNNLCICMSIALGQAVVIGVSSAWLVMSYPLFIALLWMVQRVYLPSSKRLRVLDLEAKTPLYTNFLDTLAGLPTIRAFGWFPQQLTRNKSLLDDSQRPLYLLAMIQQWLTLTMNMLVAFLAVVLVALAALLRSNAGSVGAGLVTLITLGAMLTTIINAYTGLETSLGAVSRLKSFDEETQQEDIGREQVALERTWPRTGHVRIQAANGSYDGTTTVLKELNLTIEAGQKVAICGRTGSGKSSIVALLLRLIEPLPASSPSAVPIMIDSLPLCAVNHNELRDRIISASQDAVFLPDGTSFRTNLDPWGRASDAECDTVLYDLDISSIVEARGGLDAPVSSSELSAGQKQLFSLARAVLRRRVKQRETGVDGGLVLLDEITANVDAETETNILKVLNTEFVRYTVITVTHRREMAVACDRVVVLDKGEVVEDGVPSELLQQANGWFRKLWLNTNLRS